MTRREQIVEALLGSYNDAIAGVMGKDGMLGDGDAVWLMPVAYNKSMRELERCLRELRAADRGLYWNVSERYLRCERRALNVRVRKHRPLTTNNVGVVGLVSSTDLNTHGNGSVRVLCDVWDRRVELGRVAEAVRWLAREFRGEPFLADVLVDRVPGRVTV